MTADFYTFCKNQISLVKKLFQVYVNPDNAITLYVASMLKQFTKILNLVIFRIDYAPQI
jgi:hypothetical protein